MAYTKKHVFIAISVVYLLLLTAVAAYRTFTTTHLSLPLPNSLSYLTTLLPIFAGPLLTVSHTLSRSRRRQTPTRKSYPLVLIINVALLIYSTVVITLLGTYASPSTAQPCVLRTRWTELFRAKDVAAIRAIQDALECCGFAGPRDMAWPFRDKTHDVDACTSMTGRTVGCQASWARTEKRVASLQMGVVGLVALWQVIVLVMSEDRSWTRGVIPERVVEALGGDEGRGEGGEQRAIDYLPNFNRYSDRVEEETSDNEEGNGIRKTIQAAVENGVDETNGGTSNGGERTQGRSSRENEWSRAD